MKLKKPSRRTLIAIGVVALVIFGLMANRSAEDSPPQGGLDAAAQQACSDFAVGYPDAGSKPERLTLADKVMTSTRKTDNESIAENATALGLAADDGGTPWKTSADNFTGACRAAGWVAP